MVVSAEMAVVYRFHDFIINQFPIKDASNVTLRNQSVFETGFNPQGFIDTGLENILRGMVNTYIPNFKSGVDESFRSANHYRDVSFDVATWSIVHEREQGLPTYNTYFRAYNLQGKYPFLSGLKYQDTNIPLMQNLTWLSRSQKHLKNSRQIRTRLQS